MRKRKMVAMVTIEARFSCTLDAVRKALLGRPAWLDNKIVQDQKLHLCHTLGRMGKACRKTFMSIQQIIVRIFVGDPLDLTGCS